MNNRRSIIALSLSVGVALMSGQWAQALPTSGHSKQLLMKDVPYDGHDKLTVTSPAFKDGGDIPYENTQYRGNLFPGLHWARGPRTTQSYVVIFQGLETDGQHVGGTVIALTVFNVPASIQQLAAGMTAAPAGAVLGPNVRGPNMPYAGPHVKGPAKHDYYIQVFALDTVLSADPATTYETLVSGMTGHVVALGVLHARSDMDPTATESAEPAPKN